MSAFLKEARSHRVARPPSDAGLQSGVTSSCGYLGGSPVSVYNVGDLYSLRAHTMPAIAQWPTQGIEDDINCCTTLTNGSDANAPFKLVIPVSSIASHRRPHESRSNPCCSPSAQSPVKVCPLDFLG